MKRICLPILLLSLAILISSCRPANEEKGSGPPGDTASYIPNAPDTIQAIAHEKEAVQNTIKPYRIVVLPAYDVMANAGIVEFSSDFERVFKGDTAFDLLAWPFPKDMPPYLMVYNKRYADTFFSNPGVDIVFMHRIIYNMKGGNMQETILSLEAKFYHKASGTEEVVFQHDNISIEQAKELIRKEAEEIKRKIREGIAMH